MKSLMIAAAIGFLFLAGAHAENQEINVIATATAKPGKARRLLRVLYSGVEPTRKEVGNLRYIMNRGVENPRTITFIERWESQEALNRHFETEHIQKIQEIIKSEDLLEAPPRLELYIEKK